MKTQKVLAFVGLLSIIVGLVLTISSFTTEPVDYISRKNWSNSELFESNIHSFPPDRLNKYHPFPDYLVYQPIFRYPDTLWYDNGVATEKLDILLDPNDPRIPTNFEFLFKSDKTQTVLYKIHEPKH